MDYGDERVSASGQEREMPIYGSQFWEELHGLVVRDILVEVEHVKAHRTKKEKETSLVQKFITNGSEKAELAKAGAMLDEGFYGGTESGNYAAGMRVGVFSLAVCSQLPLLGRTMERLCVHWETVCFHDAGKTRPRKQRRRQRQEQQQSHVNTSKNSQITLLSRLVFKNVYFDTMIDVTVKKREQNQLEREFTCEDLSHCLYRRSFKSVNWTIFVQSEDHKRIPQRMNHAKLILYKSTIHLCCGSSTRSSLHCGSWTENCTVDVLTQVSGRQSFPRP